MATRAKRDKVVSVKLTEREHTMLMELAYKYELPPSVVAYLAVKRTIASHSGLPIQDDLPL